MENKVKQLQQNKLVPAVLSIILGILIIIFRRSAVDMLVKIMGGVIAAGGVCFFIVYLFRKDRFPGSLPMVLAFSLITVLIGVLLIVFAPDIVDIFPVIMGIILILNGLGHLAEALAAEENRLLIGLLGVIIIALGVLIVLRPGFLVNMIMIFIGVSFVVNGLADLFLMKKVSGPVQGSGTVQ